jgi:hypothetical protein
LEDNDDISEEYINRDLPLSANLIYAYNKAKDEYIQSNDHFEALVPQKGGGPRMSCMSVKNVVAPEPSKRSSRTSSTSIGVSNECLEILDFSKAEEEQNLQDIYEYIKGDIDEFYQIMNNVFIYIDNIALFLLYKGEHITFIKTTMKKTIITNIGVLIDERKNYIGNLTTLTNAYDNMGSMSNAYNALYQSIFIKYYEKAHTGGRKQREQRVQHKRTVGRPRKIPAKPATKPTKKPVTKPAKKPDTKPAKKPTTKPAKKPITTKPAKKPTTKPTKKPTKPLAKKPTKK